MDEKEMRDAFERVSRFMDSMSPGNSPRMTTTDAPLVFFNGFGKWCAKFSTHAGKTYCSFGSSLTEAFNKLVDEPIITPDQIVD